ncbi:GerAB/ArcD/ProY family transporter [Paraliobacillus ryukyuensis]|uniref:GerAB/ArcD/ProY family transporter n=1 Tax=Paraliobacillus ryukyuensis TaxID=200904 RepID=UPI0009A80181|nr:GerAB/ArcD/ProY family transporter [Paraliobacillus ryukyuensis]
MKQTDTLKTGEMFAILSILIATRASDSTASLFTQKTQNAFWYVPIISLLVILPSLFLLFYLLKKYQDKNLIEMMETVLGGWGSKIIGLLIFFSAFLLMGLGNKSYVSQIKILYFPEAPGIIIALIFFIVIYFSAKKGWHVIAFVSKILLPFFLLSAVVLIALISNDIVVDRIFPIFGTGVQKVLWEGARKGALFHDVFLITIAYTSFEKTTYFRKGLIWGLIFSITELITFFFIYATTYDYNSIEKMSFPFHDLTQYVNFGSFLTNIETFFMVFWILASFIRFTIYLYIITWIFASLFHIKYIESLLLPIGFFNLIIGIIPENVIMNELVFRDALLNYTTPIFISFPILLWIVALAKGDLKKR